MLERAARTARRCRRQPELVLGSTKTTADVTVVRVGCSGGNDVAAGENARPLLAFLTALCGQTSGEEETASTFRCENTVALTGEILVHVMFVLAKLMQSSVAQDDHFVVLHRSVPIDHCCCSVLLTIFITQPHL